MTEINVFSYINFREYLRDYHIQRQRMEAGFTKTEFCRRLGLPNTRGYIQDIINGKILTKTYLERFIIVLNLKGDAAKYFRVLVHFNQADTHSEREYYLDQLISLNKTPQKLVEKDTYEFYKKWYHSVVFNALDVVDFKSNFSQLAKIIFPPITVNQVKASIALLKKLKLIRKNRSGFWKATDKSLTTGAFVNNELIKQFQLQCLETAKRAVLRNSTELKNISTMTISVSHALNPKLMEKIKKFKSEIRSMVHKDSLPASSIYQLNIQYFSHFK